MKNIIRIPIIFLSIFFFFSLKSCTSLKETKFKSNPDFEKNAEKYLVTSPLIIPSSEPYTFDFEDTQTNTVYEIMVQWSEESNIVDEMNKVWVEDFEKGLVSKEKELIGTRIFISRYLFILLF